MKKLCTIILILTIITLLSGCKGEKGRVYISFDWRYNPYGLYIEDSSIPYTIYSGEYYLTTGGSYYLEYYNGFPYDYWKYLDYTLTAQEGKIFFKDGANTYYDVYLGRAYPEITHYTQVLESLYISSEKEQAQSEGYIRSEFIDVSEEKTEIDLSKYEKKILSVYEESIGGYKLEVVSGVYLPKE